MTEEAAGSPGATAEAFSGVPNDGISSTGAAVAGASNGVAIAAGSAISLDGRVACAGIWNGGNSGRADVDGSAVAGGATNGAGAPGGSGSVVEGSCVAGSGSSSVAGTALAGGEGRGGAIELGVGVLPDPATSSLAPE